MDLDLLRVVSVESRRKLKLNPRSAFLSHNLVGAAHLSQGRIDNDDRHGSKDQTATGSPSHNLSEEGHLLLRIKVFIGAIMVAGGFYLLMNTVPKGFTMKRKTFAINAIFGVLYVTLGALFGLYSLFGLIGG